MKTDEQNIWLTRLAKPIIESSPLPSAPTILLTIGLIPVVLFLTFYILIIDTASGEFFYLMGLATMITVIGPYFLYRYETTIFPKFIERAKKVTPNKNNEEIKRIEKKYKLFFAKRYHYITLPWTAMALAAILINIDYFKTLGVTGYTDPVFIPYLLLTVIGGVITGIGIHMSLTTILCIREVGDLNFTIGSRRKVL